MRPSSFASAIPAEAFRCQLLASSVNGSENAESSPAGERVDPEHLDDAFGDYAERVAFEPGERFSGAYETA